MLEKKFRTMLVVLSIAVSAGLFFATESISITAQKNLEQRVRKLSGTSDIVISPLENVNTSRDIKMDELNQYSQHLEYAVGVLEGTVFYAPNIETMMYINVLGINYDDLEKFNPLSLYQEDELNQFAGNKIIISKYMSDEYGLPVGSVMELEVLGEKKSFTVAAVSYQKGLFVNETDGMVGIIPKATMAGFYNTQGKVNKIYLKLNEPLMMEELIDVLKTKYENCEIKESVSQAALTRSAAAATQPFRLVSILVIFMSIFIVYTAFNVIAIERLPVIGAFRSIGATKKKVSSLLVLESFFFGIAGGIVGCLLGIIALYFMALVYIPKLTNAAEVEISFQMIQFVITIGFAILLSVGSSLIPILKTTKFSIKEIILNNRLQKKVKTKTIAPILAMIIFIGSVIAPRFFATNFISFILSNIFLVGVLVALLLVIPEATKKATKILINILSKLSFIPNEISVGVKNINENKSLLNNIKLIAISIAGLLFIMTITVSISENISNIYDKQFSYDIRLTFRQANDNLIDKLSQIEGVKDFTNIFSFNHIDITNKQYHLNTLYGVDDRKFFDYHEMKYDAEALKAIHQINDGRNLLMTNLVKSKLGLELGDKLILEINGEKYEYTLTGFVDTSFARGDVAFISGDNMKKSTGLEYYTSTFVIADQDIDTTYNNIKRSFLKDILVIRTIQELEEINKAPLSSIFDIIIAYSILAVLIGVVGIINNLIVSFIERKRYLAIFRSIGMSKYGMIKMLAAESLFVGVFGVIYGVIGALAMISIMPYMLSFVYGEIKAFYSVEMFIILTGAAVIIMFLTGIIPAMKSTKMSIIESIKYE